MKLKYMEKEEPGLDLGNNIEDKVLEFQKTGNVNLRNEILLSKAKLINTILRPFSNSNLVNDLRQEAYLGVIEAIDKYKKGGSFNKCAFFHVRNSIYRNYFECSSVLKINPSAIFKFNKLKRAKEELAEKLGREPKDYEISDFTGVPVRQVINYLNIMGSSFSVNETNENGDIKFDLPADPLNDNSEEQNLILDALESLKPIEKMVIEYRFGLGGRERHTLEEITAIIGKTKERIRQIEEEALEKVKLRIKKLNLK